jgi:small-conductance mechanosensitive channel
MQALFDWYDILSVPLQRLVIVVGILIFTIIIARIVKVILVKTFEKSSLALKVDPTRYSFLRHAIIISIYVLGIIGIIYTIPSLRTLSVSLLAGAGVLAVIIGFASQAAFANIVSGIFIVIFKPFRVGDRISIAQDLGIVEDITLRHTVIRTFENKRVIIPNTVISNERIENSNISDEKICKWIKFGISYDSDVDKAKKIMQKEAEKHPLTIDNRGDEEKQNKDPIVRVRVVGLGDSSVNLQAWVWATSPADAWIIGCDLYESIKKKFDSAGIEIPFPHRTIVQKANKIGKKR